LIWWEVDLTGVDLTGVGFMGVDLMGVNFWHLSSHFLAIEGCEMLRGTLYIA